MKKDIHPKKQLFVFQDASTGAQFLIESTMAPKDPKMVKYTDGKEYPQYLSDVTSNSHPFYTGQEKTLDSAGRAEQFKQRAAKAKK
jgi:large subunit ribosomal protein L31